MKAESSGSSATGSSGSSSEFPEIHVEGSYACMLWLLGGVTPTPLSAPPPQRAFPVVRLWAIMQWSIRNRVVRIGGGSLWP